MSQLQHALPAEQDVLVLGEALINGLSDDRPSSQLQPPNPDSNSILDFRNFVTPSALREDLRNELKAFSVETMRPQLQEMVKMVRAQLQDMVKLVRDDFELLRSDVVSRVHPNPENVVAATLIDPQAESISSLDQELRNLIDDRPQEAMRPRNQITSVVESVDSANPFREIQSQPARAAAAGHGLFHGRAFRGNMAANVLRDFNMSEERGEKERGRTSSKAGLLRQSERLAEKHAEDRLLDRKALKRAATHQSLMEITDARKGHATPIVPQSTSDSEDVLQTSLEDDRGLQPSTASAPSVVKEDFRSKLRHTLSGIIHGKFTEFRKPSDRISQGEGFTRARVASGHESIRCSQESRDRKVTHQSTLASAPSQSHHRKTQRDKVFLGKALAQSEPEILEEESESGSKIRNRLTHFVNTLAFDGISASLIALNAVWIGVQTDTVARHPEDHVLPGYFATVDLFFCIAFSTELALRLYVFRCPFFYGKGWQWNHFDTVLVVAQLSEEFLARFAVSASTSQYSFMRVLRILRLIRVVRLVRIVRMIGELRTLVTSIISSLKSLSWTVVLLSGMMYVVGIYFTQLVSDHGRDDDVLKTFFGSLGRSLLSLFEAFTGGVDWDTLASPLLTSVHPLSAVVFALYIAFAVLAVLNVVTGVFVESALAVTRHDKDVDLVNHLREVFAKTDTNGNGILEWEEFESVIEDPSMDVVFKAVDLDRSEARGLFELIDVENNGEISREEFIMGCLRLKGGAKALDLATLMYDNKRLANMLEEHMNIVEEYIAERMRNWQAAHGSHD